MARVGVGGGGSEGDEFGSDGSELVFERLVGEVEGQDFPGEAANGILGVVGASRTIGGEAANASKDGVQFSGIEDGVLAEVALGPVVGVVRVVGVGGVVVHEVIYGFPFNVDLGDLRGSRGGSDLG